MKLASTTLGAALAVSLQTSPLLAQGTPETLKTSPALSLNTSLELTNAHRHPGLTPAAPAVSPSLSLTNRNWQQPGLRLAMQPPKPGVYESYPYTCIVVVPGPQLDDQCIVKPGSGPRMPSVRPELRLVPREQRQAE